MSVLGQLRINHPALYQALMAYDEHAGDGDHPEEDHLEQDIKTMTGQTMGL